MVTPLLVHQEFHCTRIDIFSSSAKLESIRPQSFSCCLRDPKSRSYLNDFLVAPLNTTVALKQVYEITMNISENLNLNMPWLLH